MLEKEARLLRIFIGENDRYHGQPLFEWILGQARAQGLAGATVLRGLEGFGGKSHLHSAKVLALSSDLPIVIELVDRAEKTEAFLQTIEPAVTDGLVTEEAVQVRLHRR